MTPKRFSPDLHITSTTTFFYIYWCFLFLFFRDENGPKFDNISLSDDFGKQIESDEDSMGEYGGDLDISKFNEDGSFIGIYADKLNNSKQSTVW